MPSTLIKSCLILLITFCVSTQLAAQDNGGDDQEDRSTDYSAEMMQLDFGIFNGILYSDPLGIQLSAQQIPLEQPIDKNTYTLGMSDLLTIKMEASQTMFMRGIIVNPQGDISLPQLGPINVDGMTIAEAEEAIKEEASTILRETPEVIITLERLRPIYVRVKGGVPHPGLYLIPSQSRVDQAIFSSLNDGNRNLRNTSLSNTANILNTGNYSFRNVKITRSTGEKVTADLVSYFRIGDKEYNPIVQDGDVIELNPLNIETPKVSISGAVKTDYEFQFVEGDTPYQLLQIGGGFEEIADTTHLLVFRRTGNGAEQIRVESNEWHDFQLQPNDRVIAPFGDEANTSASAWVHGEVQIPGNFPITTGETTALDLLELTGGLTRDALPQAAYLMRSGGIRNEIPNKFNADLMRRTSDQVIQGLEYLETETQLSQNRVFIDLEDDSQLAGLKIFDGDRLYIPRDENTVFVFGQVNNPGYFPFTDNTTTNGYINRAGGFALSADRDRVFIIKSGNATWYRPGETELESGDRIFVDRQPIEELNALRTYEIQQQQIKNTRTQLILTAISTITGIITTFVAIQNLRD